MKHSYVVHAEANAILWDKTGDRCAGRSVCHPDAVQPLRCHACPRYEACACGASMRTARDRCGGVPPLARKPMSSARTRNRFEKHGILHVYVGAEAGTTPVHRSYHELTGQSPDELVEHVAMAAAGSSPTRPRRTWGRSSRAIAPSRTGWTCGDVEGEAHQTGHPVQRAPSQWKKGCIQGRRTTEHLAKRLFPGRKRTTFRNTNPPSYSNTGPFSPLFPLPPAAQLPALPLRISSSSDSHISASSSGAALCRYLIGRREYNVLAGVAHRQSVSSSRTTSRAQFGLNRMPEPSPVGMVRRPPGAKS